MLLVGMPGITAEDSTSGILRIFGAGLIFALPPVSRWPHGEKRLNASTGLYVEVQLPSEAVDAHDALHGNARIALSSSHRLSMNEVAELSGVSTNFAPPPSADAMPSLAVRVIAPLGARFRADLGRVYGAGWPATERPGLQTTTVHFARPRGTGKATALAEAITAKSVCSGGQWEQLISPVLFGYRVRFGDGATLGNGTVVIIDGDRGGP